MGELFNVYSFALFFAVFLVGFQGILKFKGIFFFLDFTTFRFYHIYLLYSLILFENVFERLYSRKRLPPKAFT